MRGDRRIKPVWTDTRNAGGVPLATYTWLRLDVPGNMGKQHRDHLVELLRDEAERLGVILTPWKETP